MNSALVTVGLPFTHVDSQLASAMSSVLAQTWEEWELLLVADGPEYGEVPSAWLADSRVRLLADGNRRGLARRLNQITGLARGEFIARMDADDIMHSERLAQQVAYMQHHESTQVVGTAAWIIDSENEVYGTRCTRRPVDEPAAPMRNDFMTHPTIMARRSWMLPNSYDEHFPRAQDKELWCRTWEPGVFARMENPLLFYRVDRAGLPNNYWVTKKMERRIFWLHGPRLVGRFRTLWAVARSYIQGAIAKLWGLVGLDSYIVRRRSATVPLSVQATARGALTTSMTSFADLTSALASAPGSR